MGVMDPVLTGDDDEIGVVRDDVEVPGVLPATIPLAWCPCLLSSKTHAPVWGMASLI